MRKESGERTGCVESRLVLGGSEEDMLAVGEAI